MRFFYYNLNLSIGHLTNIIYHQHSTKERKFDYFEFSLINFKLSFYSFYEDF